MKETAVQVNQRQIRNGIRKQAEAIQREKDKVWDKLKDEGKLKSGVSKEWKAQLVGKLQRMSIESGIDFADEIENIKNA